MTTAEVYLWGSRIGVVTYEDGNPACRFQYAHDFLNSHIEVSPLMMPLSRQIYYFPELSEKSFYGLPGMLADSLPDKYGNAIMDAWMFRHGREGQTLNSVERLCYTGKRGMGALEYIPALGPDAGDEEVIHVNELVELASMILTKRKDIYLSASQETMQQMIRVGTSAGGARAKAVIAWNPQTNIIRSGQIDAGDGYEYWLIKFDHVSNNRDKESEDGTEYTRIEYAYYLMAINAGITMSECRLYEEDGCYHFMTRRFDRIGNAGTKLHMQTLGAIAHFDYNMPGVNSYEQTAGIMRRLRLGQDSIEELFRRMVFNVLAWNQDDHVKNISFLMDRTGKWSLSPAYDVTFAYNPGGLWTGSHQMTVNGKRSNITQEDLIAAGRAMDITDARMKDIIMDVKKSILKWPKFASRAKVSEATMQRIKNILSPTYP